MGGGIFAEKGATVTIHTSHFYKNVALGTVMRAAWAEGRSGPVLFTTGVVSTGGGAVAVVDDSFTTISNSSFLENAALLSGGAVYSLANQELLVSDSHFDGNELDVFTGQFNVHKGGAIVSHSTLTFETTNCVFLNHRWFAPVFNVQWGGAVFVQNADSYSSTNDLFVNNGFRDDAPRTLLLFLNLVSILGGALGVASTTDVLIDSSVFELNTAEAGGGIYYQAFGGSSKARIENAAFFKNEAIGRGGGINVNGPTAGASISDSLFSGNRAGYGAHLNVFQGLEYDTTVTNSTFELGHAHQGGAAAILSSGSSATFEDCLFQNNKADIIESHFQQENQDSSDGGAIDFNAYGVTSGRPIVFSFINTRLFNNSALVDGGAIQLNRLEPASTIPTMNYTLFIDGLSEITFNTAQTGQGGGVHVKDLSNTTDHTVIFDKATVISNLPDDIHSNETGPVLGTLATFADAITTGNPDLFAGLS